ncbi:threonine/serine dehydratase [Actinoallomurus iriomotensis]|uniref:threonine ammonia-lyase n=1 Tax=Actinoallomurus iriomotensis TaxID=478107 RepID=A0A9W6RYN0_9ACTN|nr:threonine/serine dehydratase [Actinoallomurus iriomotensis]GLY84063.1 threonine dehydratase [Actinoallomurus iriomotensis]
MISRGDVEAARTRIDSRVLRTPVLRLDRLWLKLEQLQHTGSFKARGAFNRVLAAAETDGLPEAGVIAASGGNAGLAFAYAARELGARAEVFVPETAPPVKVARLRALGAAVRQVGREYAEAYEAATKRAADTGALFGHPYDQPEVCAGQGTLALELEEQTGGVETVLVSVGGGGLMAGIAAALEGRSRVVAVEPEACPSFHAALEAGRPVDAPVSGVAADSLGARRVGDIPYAVARRTAVESILVSDADVIAARRALWQDHHIVVEHGTAAAYAALLTGAYTPSTDETVAVICCGANTDPADLA